MIWWNCWLPVILYTQLHGLSPLHSYHQGLIGCARFVSHVETCKDDLCRWPGVCSKALTNYMLKQNLRCLRSIHHIRRSKQLVLNTTALMKLNDKLNNNNVILSCLFYLGMVSTAMGITLFRQDWSSSSLSGDIPLGSLELTLVKTRHRTMLWEIMSKESNVSVVWGIIW